MHFRFVLHSPLICQIQISQIQICQMLVLICSIKIIFLPSKQFFGLQDIFGTYFEDFLARRLEQVLKMSLKRFEYVCVLESLLEIPNFPIISSSQRNTVRGWTSHSIKNLQMQYKTLPKTLYTFPKNGLFLFYDFLISALFLFVSCLIF